MDPCLEFGFRPNDMFFSFVLVQFYVVETKEYNTGVSLYLWHTLVLHTAANTLVCFSQRQV